MKIGVAAVNECSDLATFLMVEIESHGHHVTEFSAAADTSEDSGELAEAVGRAVASRQVKTAILICRTGIPMTIAVNKVSGVRGTFCTSMDTVIRSRTEFEANVICLAADQSDPHELSRLISSW